MTNQEAIITKYRLNLAVLKDLPRDEVKLFLALGHLHNELSLLQKLAQWSYDDRDAEPQLQGRMTQGMIFLRYLGARMFEGWQTIQRDFFGRRVSQVYEPHLSGVARTAYESVKSYHSRRNSLKELRNSFAFHSSGEDIGRGLDHPAVGPLTIYLGKTLPESLFFASEVVLNAAMLGSAELDSGRSKLYNLMSEITGEAVNWLLFTQGLMDVFLKLHPSVQEKETEQFSVSGIPNFDEVRIPWFTLIPHGRMSAPNPPPAADG